MPILLNDENLWVLRQILIYGETNKILIVV